MRAHFSGRSLQLSGGRSVAVDGAILDAIDTGTVLVVVLDQPPHMTLSENVVGLDHQGRIIWRVRPRDLPGPGFYTGVAERADGVWLIHYSGFIVRIDPATGRVLGQQFAK